MKNAKEMHEVMQNAIDEKARQDHEKVRDFVCKHYISDMMTAAESGRSYVVVAKIKNIDLRPEVVKFLQNLGYQVNNENLDQIKIAW